MKSRILSAGVFMTLMLSSLLAGHHGYCGVKEAITADLNQALIRTLEEKRDNLVTQDTIRAYKRIRDTAGGEVWLAIADERFCRNLSDKRLRKTAFITFDIVDNRHCRKKTREPGIIASDTLLIDNKATGDTLAVKSYARLSAASIFSLSDQRLSFSLAFAALAWALCMGFLLRKRQEERNTVPENYGGIYYSSDDHCFHNIHHMPIRLTPMQQQLLLMLWEAPSHTLTKKEICASLWPKKDNADDTLYTLVRRLKPVIENNSSLKIVAYRGQNYSLENK